jgi:hypothetical protein
MISIGTVKKRIFEMETHQTSLDMKIYNCARLIDIVLGILNDMPGIKESDYDKRAQLFSTLDTIKDVLDASSDKILTAHLNE